MFEWPGRLNAADRESSDTKSIRILAHSSATQTNETEAVGVSDGPMVNVASL
jgi:hypothetical protein